MKQIFSSRKPARAVARPRREPSPANKMPYESIAFALAVWLGILVVGQLLARLPDLPVPQSRAAMTQAALPVY